MMKRVVKFLLKPILGRKAFQKFFSALHFFILKGMNIGGGSDLRQSGETWVMGYFAKSCQHESRPLVIFDVGANVGGYALAFAEILRKKAVKAKIYCFEPSHHTFFQLTNSAAAFSEIEAVNEGLGDKPGNLTLHSRAGMSGLSSLYNRQLPGNTFLNEEESVRIDTIENFCREKNIHQIDFLKLDVEGHELKVLEGARQMLSSGSINFIQFEFGGTDIDSRVFLRDFFNLLQEKYKLYRILQNGLQQLSSYSERDEIFVTTNFLAIKK